MVTIYHPNHSPFSKKNDFTLLYYSFCLSQLSIFNIFRTILIFIWHTTLSSDMNFLMQISNISAFDYTNPSKVSFKIFLYLPIKSI